MKVLVTDGEERAALAAVRSLGRKDEIHVLGEEHVSLAGVSRYAHCRHRVPAPIVQPERFREEVASVVARLGLDAVLPITDASSRALLADPEALAPAVLVAPTPIAYERLSDKALVARLAPRHGILVPPGSDVGSESDALRLAAELGWPVVLKPVASLVEAPDRSMRKTRVRIAAGPEELVRAWREDVPGGRALVQSVVPGRGEGIFVLRRRGRTLAAFAHRRLREKPPEGGVSVLRESVTVDRRLMEGIEALLDELGFEGAAMAEFRSDGRRSWLIEFNARLWGSVQLAIDAGIDFPRLLVDAWTGHVAQSVPPYRTGVRSRWLLGDFDHALALARGHTDSAGRTGPFQALQTLLRPAGGETRWEVLRARDPRPFLRELRLWLRSALR